MAKLIFSLLFILGPSWAVAQTCDQDRAAAIAQMSSWCNTPYCQENEISKSCTYYSGPVLKRYRSAAGQLGHEVYCPYTWTYDTFYPNEPPTHDSGAGEAYVGGVWDCENPGPHPAPPPQPQCKREGSIVSVESQALGESIPIVAAKFGLVYSSALQDGRVSDYKFHMNISGATPRDYIQSFIVETRRDGVLVDSASYSNTLPNQKYEFTWNGLDVTNTTELTSQKFEVTFKEISPSGTFPSMYEVLLGHFKAQSIQLGGWLPSILKNYDPNANRIINALGERRSVEAKAFGPAQMYVADNDEDLVYIFDLSGRHIQTKTSLTGATVFTFNYDSLGRLASIDEPFGKTTTFNRNVLGKLLSITSPMGKLPP